MNKLLLLLLLALAVSALMAPLFPGTDGMVRVDLERSGGKLLLTGGGKRLELPDPTDVVYSSGDPLDFFPELIDPAYLQRLELIPYGSSLSCNVLTAQGRTVAGDYRFCLAISIKLGVPLYVHEELFEENFSLPRSL